MSSQLGNQRIGLGAQRALQLRQAHRRAVRQGAAQPQHQVETSIGCSRAQRGGRGTGSLAQQSLHHHSLYAPARLAPGDGEAEPHARSVGPRPRRHCGFTHDVPYSAHFEPRLRCQRRDPGGRCKPLARGPPRRELSGHRRELLRRAQLFGSGQGAGRPDRRAARLRPRGASAPWRAAHSTRPARRACSCVPENHGCACA